jgi:activator of 2-hydroxyglutaryl-CoA dehydratase
LINEGIDVTNIIAGINSSVANRLFAMVRRVGLTQELVLTGGCSKNDGLAKALEKRLGIAVTTLSQDPQLTGAVGAALIASEKTLSN